MKICWRASRKRYPGQAQQQVQQQNVSTQIMWNPFASSAQEIVLPINPFEQSHQWNDERTNNFLL